MFNTVELFTPGEVQNKKKTFTKFGKYSLKLYFNTEDLQFIINCNIQHINKNFQTKKNDKPLEVDFKIGDYTFNNIQRLLLFNGSTTKLTTKENALLTLLCQRKNDLLEREYALKTIWGDDNFFTARSMDVFITKLRKKLKQDKNLQIVNVRGFGYKLIS